MSGANVHDPKYREAKPPQGGPDVPLQELFRLDKRTIIGTFTFWIIPQVEYLTVSRLREQVGSWE